MTPFDLSITVHGLPDILVVEPEYLTPGHPVLGHIHPVGYRIVRWRQRGNTVGILI